MMSYEDQEIIRKIVREELLRFDETASDRCSHEWIEKPSGLPEVYYSGTNAYTKCRKCGKKEKI